MQVSPTVALVLAVVLFVLGSLFLGQVIQSTAQFIAGIPLIVLGLGALGVGIYFYKPEVFGRSDVKV